MTKATTIQFPAHTGNRYVNTDVNASMPMGTVSLQGLKGAELVALHNSLADNLADTPNPPSKTRKFADNTKAVARTWKLLEAFQAAIDAERAGDGFEMSAEELAGQKVRAEELAGQKVRAEVQADKAPEPAPAVVLSDADRKQVADEAASRPKPTPAKRGSQAGTIRKPRAPKPDDGAIRMPTEGGKQRAKRQKDGSYAFRIPAGKPRTQTVSPEREELLGLLVGDGATWADIVAQLNKQDDANNFKAVTTVTMFCITLGYGLETQPDGTIKLLEPLA